MLAFVIEVVQAETINNEVTDKVFEIFIDSDFYS